MADQRWAIVDTWNGGKGGRKIVFVSTMVENAGHNQCFEWIHRHTPFSYNEATKNQGYSVEPAPTECPRCGLGLQPDEEGILGCLECGSVVDYYKDK